MPRKSGLSKKWIIRGLTESKEEFPFGVWLRDSMLVFGGPYKFEEDMVRTMSELGFSTACEIVSERTERTRVRHCILLHKTDPSVPTALVALMRYAEKRGTEVDNFRRLMT